MSRAPSISVEHTGAWQGDTLLGSRNNNMALAIRLLATPERRADGKIGRLDVPFEVLHAGCGYYGDIFREFVGRTLTRSDIAAWAESQSSVPEFRSRYPRFSEDFQGLNANSLVNADLHRHEAGD